MKRALLVRTGAVGDYVLSLRVVEALRDSGARGVTVLGRPQTSGLGSMAGVDRFLDIESRGFFHLFSMLSPLPETVTGALAHHDIVVNMLGVADGGIFSRRLAEVTGGFVIDLNPKPAPDWTLHITEQWLADLNDHGLRTDAGPPRLKVPPRARLRARDQLSGLGGSFCVVIQPGSGGLVKCWPWESFVELARKLASRSISVAFLLGPVELEAWPSEARRAMDSAAHIIVESSLPEVAAILSVASVYVGNDSGITHLAAASGAQTVAVFGPTDPRIWAPIGNNVSVLGGCGEWPAFHQVLDEVRSALTRKVEGLGTEP